MDETIASHKVLRVLIEDFMNAFDTYIEDKKVNKTKVYFEVLNRKFIVSHEIGRIAKDVLTSYKTAEMPVSADIIEKKIACLVDNLLQQDLLECALNVSSNVSLTSDEMHDALFTCCLNDMTSLFMNQFPSLGLRGSENGCNLPQPLLSFHNDKVNNNFYSMSVEFENSLKQFEEDLFHIKSAVSPEFSISNLKINDIGSKSNEKSAEDAKKSCIPGNVPSVDISFGDWLLSTISKDGSQDAFGCVYSTVPSWESQMKQSIPCHLYSSELVGKEVLLNVTEEDSQMFTTLHESSSVLSEKDFILDVLDMLVGIPSPTFLYDDSKRKFLLKPFVRLSNLSHESTSRFSEKFMECGTMFYKLKAFCSESIPGKGSILQGLKEGVHEILSVYMMYIVAVKKNRPTVQLLKTDILENAQLLITLGNICDIQLDKSVSAGEGLKGLSLLSCIHSSAWSCRNKGNVIMIAVLLKHLYSPYFNFLNKWMAEGICCDPYDEFQIIEDFKYLDRRDELYWKFTYTENEDDASRMIPKEIKKYSHDILQCGKSMRLLQDCCPQLYSLEYLSCNPPPCISMVFSYEAIAQKNEQCTSYIVEKDAVEKKYRESGTDISEDEFNIEKQMFVDDKAVLRDVNRRWDKLSMFGSSNIDVSRNQRRSKCLRRSSSFSSLTKENIGFSGVIFGNVGLVFSSCGYNVVPQCSAELCHKASTMYSKQFNQQLNLKSYFHSVPYTSEQTQRKYIKKPSSVRNELQKASQTVKQDGPNRNYIPPGSFLDCLASLLISEYGDSKEDVYAFLQLASLQKILEHNFSPILNMRMHLVQKTIMDYIVNQLKLQELLLCLKNIYFLQDESFSQNLCEQLFMRAFNCSKLHEFTDWIILNEILSRAISVPSLSNVHFLESASINFVNLPEEETTEKNLFLHFFNFEFKIEWPLNIIVHKACITHYSGIFSFIMEMEFLCWLLGKLWRLFLTDVKFNCEDESVLENSPQYRTVMLQRFDMHQFVRVLHNCIHQDLGGPLWDSMVKSLNTEELSIDALEEIHCQYLERALVRCFLTEETSFLQDLLKSLFLQTYKFCEVALVCSWKFNTHSNSYETPDFECLSSLYGSYKTCKDRFYDWIMLAVGRRFGRSLDEHYPLFLETLLETGRS